jgi:hypothetical protein
MDTKEWMVEEISKELILLLMNEHKFTMQQAFDKLYNSKTYSSLINYDSGLYTQSTAYIYDYLNTEITTGRMC